MNAVDTASNEMLSSEFLRKSVGGLKPLCKNLKSTLPDVSRCGRRLISRPWTKISRLENVLSKYARGRRSPCQLLHHSKELRLVWKQMLKRWFGKFAGNMAAAKHRFSWAKPLCRFIRCLSIQMKFLLYVMEHLTGKPRDAAEEFLLTCDNEEFLDVALMADTGCEDLILVRVGDRGRLLDVSRLDLSLVHFVMRCKQLIVDRVALTSKVTYTGILMNMFGTSFSN